MSNRNQKNNNETWRLHDTYRPGASINRVVTRSQTAFNRIKNTPSDLDLFSDARRHQPPGMQHLMVTLKGQYGSIPRTVVTRSTGLFLDVSEELCQAVDEYKAATEQDYQFKEETSSEPE